MKIGFVKFPELLVLEDGVTRPWMLHEDFPVWIEIEGLRTIVTVPKVFQTDLLSLPAPLRAIWRPDGPAKQAAVIHDYLCKLGQLGKPTVREGIAFSSADAAAVFLGGLKTCGVNYPQRYLWWSMVRMFGPQFSAPSKEA